MIVEHLERRTWSAHRLTYTLLTFTPSRGCLRTIVVPDLGPSQAEAAWSATFQPDGLPASEAVAPLEGALAANCRALKQLLER